MRDSGRVRRDTCVSDFPLLELARFRFEERWDSRGSDGLFAFLPFIVPLVEGCSSTGDLEFVDSSFLGVILLFRPQQRVSFESGA